MLWRGGERDPGVSCSRSREGVTGPLYDSGRRGVWKWSGPLYERAGSDSRPSSTHGLRRSREVAGRSAGNAVTAGVRMCGAMFNPLAAGTGFQRRPTDRESRQPVRRFLRSPTAIPIGHRTAVPERTGPDSLQSHNITSGPRAQRFCTETDGRPARKSGEECHSLEQVF